MKLKNKPKKEGEEHDYSSFTPETVDFDAIIDGREPAAPKVEAEITTPPSVVPPVPVETPAPKVDDADEFDIEARPNLEVANPPPAKPGRPANAAMREQLTLINAQKKELEDKLKAEQTEREQTLAKWESEKTAREAAEARFQELANKEGSKNIAQHPSVREIVEPWENAFRSVCEDLEDAGIPDPLGKQQLVVNLSRAYTEAKSTEDKEEAQNMLEKIRDTVSREFGDEHSGQMMRLVRDGAQRLVQVRQKMEELQRNYPEVEYQTELQGFRGVLDEYTKLDGECFNPDATTEQQDPFNPRVILKNMISTVPELRKNADSAISFSRRAMLPPSPINPADLAHLDPEQRKAAIAAHNNRTTEARKHLAKILPEALIARQILPGLMERVSMLEKIVAGERTVTRGKSIVEDEPIIQDDEEDDGDPRNFKPSNPELDKFERELNGKR